jgi:acetyl esterase/lipase
MVFVGFFGLFIFGALYAYFVRKFAASTPLEAANAPEGKGSKRYQVGHTLIAIVCIVIICFMGYFAVLALAGSDLGQSTIPGDAGTINGLLGLAGGMFGGFWCFITLTATLILLKITRQYPRPTIFSAIGLIGLVFSCILFSPVIATPASAATADASFAAAFGANWQSRIPASAESYFQPTQFVVPGYYLGIPPKQCVIDKNVLFFAGSSGSVSDLKLYFDAYLPPNNGVGLPGHNSTVIRIHGGAWVIGDKSMAGMLQVDEYLAAQGYCVFDIQYGMLNSTLLNSSSGVSIFGALSAYGTPANVVGNFTMNDMMLQIGAFCKYLTAHQAEYGANLSSTFISGGSAGGQLTCATALAIANGGFASYFGTGLTIRGYIPLYPANGLVFFDQTNSTPYFDDPSLLVNSDSPPCLMYQGAQDGLVDPTIAQHFQDAYKNSNNPACAIIWMPEAGHGSDLYYSGYYNTFFLYYMERFLYLER